MSSRSSAGLKILPQNGAKQMMHCFTTYSKAGNTAQSLKEASAQGLLCAFSSNVKDKVIKTRVLVYRF